MPALFDTEMAFLFVVTSTKNCCHFERSEKSVPIWLRSNKFLLILRRNNDMDLSPRKHRIPNLR